MINIVVESYLSKIITYKEYEYIAKSNEAFCFPLHDLLRDEKLFSSKYILKISSTVDYLFSILDLLYIAIDEKNKLDIQLAKNSELDKNIYNIFRVDDIPINLTRKEKDGYDIIQHGKITYSAAKKVLEFNIAPEWLQKLINEKDKKIMEFYSEKEHQKSFEYENVYADEISIYTFLMKDLLKFDFLQKEIAKYCTAQNYFTNSGTSYFAINDELYNYFIGNKKGKLPNFTKQSNIKKNPDIKKFNLFKEQLSKLKVSLNDFLPAIYSKNIQNVTIKENKNDFITKFFQIHEISKTVFDYLENKKMISKGSTNPYKIENKYKHQIITMFCYVCKNQNPDYNLYADLFENYTRNPKQKYKYNKQNNSDYLNTKIKPLLAEINR